MRVNRSFFILLSALAFVFSSCLTTTSVRFEPGRDAARMAKIPAAAAPATFYEGSVPALFNRGYVQLGSVYYETLYRRGQPNGEKLDESARRAIVSNQKLNRELYADAMAKEAAARGGELLGPVGVDLREDFRVTEGPCLETRETRVYNAATKRYDTRYECVRKSTVHYYDYYLRVSANVYAQPPAGLFTKEEIAGRANEKARNDLIGAYFRFRQAVKSGDPAASDRARSSLAYDEEELKKAVAPALKQWRLESVERDRKIVALLEKFAR